MGASVLEPILIILHVDMKFRGVRVVWCTPVLTLFCGFSQFLEIDLGERLTFRETLITESLLTNYYVHMLRLCG